MNASSESGLWPTWITRDIGNWRLGVRNQSRGHTRNKDHKPQATGDGSTAGAGSADRGVDVRFVSRVLIQSAGQLAGFGREQPFFDSGAGGVVSPGVGDGGGGLIAGVAADLKYHRPGIRVIGAQPINSRVMAESVRAGHVLELPSEPTLSDGTAGGVEIDSITFPYCRDLVDEWIEVPEADIARSMRQTIEEEHMLIEGAAAVAVAVVAERRTTFTGPVAVVLCGANVSAERVRSVL